MAFWRRAQSLLLLSIDSPFSFIHLPGPPHPCPMFIWWLDTRTHAQTHTRHFRPSCSRVIAASPGQPTSQPAKSVPPPHLGGNDEYGTALRLSHHSTPGQAQVTGLCRDNRRKSNTAGWRGGPLRRKSTGGGHHRDARTSFPVRLPSGCPGGMKSAFCSRSDRRLFLVPLSTPGTTHHLTSISELMETAGEETEGSRTMDSNSCGVERRGRTRAGGFCLLIMGENSGRARARV